MIDSKGRFYERTNSKRYIGGGGFYLYIPDNATNGDMIKALFPNASRTAENDNYVYIENLDSYIPHEFFSNWWNSPYKRGDME